MRYFYDHYIRSSDVGLFKGVCILFLNPRIVVKGVPFTAGSLLVFAAFLLFSIMPAAMEILDRRMWKARRGQVESAAPAGYRLWEVE